jgi:hypothetical protein
MSRGLSSAAKAELYAAQTSGVWLVLLTVEHASFSTLRYVNDRANITSGGDTYTAMAFSCRLPADRDGPVRAIVSLDNVDRATIASVRAVTSPATVTLEVIRQSAPDTIVVSYPYLQLVGCTITTDRIDFELGSDPVLDEAYPGLEFTPLSFPAGFDR